MPSLRALGAFACCFLFPAAALDDGLALSPPMGWRGWLLFGTSPSQRKMEAVLPAMVSRDRSVGGKPTSLCDLGYCSAGLDNNWQKCQKEGEYAYHFPNGTPAVDTQRFPSMANMTRTAHGIEHDGRAAPHTACCPASCCVWQLRCPARAPGITTARSHSLRGTKSG